VASVWRVFAAKLQWILGKREAAYDFDDEMQAHVRLLTERYRQQGMPAEDAARAAHRQFGNTTFLQQEQREMRTFRSLDTFWRDLRYGARQLRMNPLFTAVAVLSLALGIGANTAIFELVNAVRLRTLPVEKPEQLAYLDFRKGAEMDGNFNTRSARFTYAQWVQIESRQQAFSGMAAWSARQFNLASGGEVRWAEGLHVNGDFFRVLGVQPMLGRAFSKGEDQPGCGSAGAVISYGFWQREFGGPADVLERSVTLDGRPFPILGVTPPAFTGVEVGNRFDVAVPLCAEALMADDGRGRIARDTSWWLSAMGRLKPGWTLERASAEFAALAPVVMRATLPPSYRPDEAKRYLKNQFEITPGATGVSNLRRAYEEPLWLLLAITGLVLLIACANLANLLLARASVREREIAVRQAMGASRPRLVTQLMAESLLLALLGTSLGIALAQALSRGIIAFLSTADSGILLGLSLDGRVLGFTAAIALGTCLLFGLAPALRATRIAPSAAMRAGGRSLSGGREGFSLRRALVVAQVALSLVLLVGAFLFVGSLRKLLAVDPGFRAEGVVAAEVGFGRAHFPRERRLEVYRELMEHLRARMGVTSVAQASMTPVSGSGWNNLCWAEDSTARRELSNLARVSPGYFKTMDTPLVAGRDFNDRDTLGSPRVAIVNQAFAKLFFGGDNPVGRTFLVQGDEGQPDDRYQVVGLARNSKYREIREDSAPVGYFPMAQDENPGPGGIFVFRTSAPLGEALRGATAALTEVSPSIGVEFTVLTQQMQNSLLRDRLMATLAGAFGLLASLLATLGLYGVIAYMVARRRNEIGIRMALGADRVGVVWLVLREAAVLLACGLGIGAGLALWAGQAAGSLLFSLKPNDLTTLLGAMALLAAVAVVASCGPARRAARLEPMLALRDE
jgi:putative ABC transport system permease protein